jgi:hypothetical protein
VISYILWPFLEGYDSTKARGHTNAWEVVKIAEIFVDLGFCVEVVDWQNTSYIPPADCLIVVDIDKNLERWADSLPPKCIKIFHATGPHWLESNIGELTRIENIRKRKGVALMPRRQVQFNRGAEVADHITVLGNDYTISTYLSGRVPVTRIPISSAYEFEWPKNRDLHSAKRHFFWLSSYGMAWKGLDLALEAFSGMPELCLTVCGRPEKEKDFFDLYERELLHTANIKFVGWMDLASPEFLEIAGSHAFVIQLGSAEGGGGSAIHCMHAGMIPICTKENSIDLGDFGCLVDTPDVQSVQAVCRQASGLTEKEIERRANASWNHVRTFHTRNTFASKYKEFAHQICSQL